MREAESNISMRIEELEDKSGVEVAGRGVLHLSVLMETMRREGFEFQVDRQASRLLSLMTDGRWVKVVMTPEGRLQVMDAVKTEREPVHLSLGTCQQLYLALRIALLMTADNVGRSVPILADDILVNFDARRRIGAARALAELSRTRQVILFTCHEEIVESMRSVDPALNVVEL